MKKLGAFLLVAAALANWPSAASELKLWFNEPAAKWDQALPIGNGRLGAMHFGGLTNDVLQLNEATLTSDEPGYRNLPIDIRKTFSQVTNLIAQRQFAEADKFVTENWLGRAWACYQPLGEIHFDFAHAGPIGNFRRELDLADAVARVSYDCGGARFQREIIASHPDELIAIRLTCSQPGKLNLRLYFTSPHSNAVAQASTQTLALSGQAPGFVLRRTLDWVEKQKDNWKYPELYDKNGKALPHASQVLYGQDIQGKGAKFAAEIRVQLKGGKAVVEGNALSIADADEVVLHYSAATSYNGFDKSPSRQGVDPVKKAKGFLDLAQGRDFASLLARHTQDFHGLFNRVSLTLGQPSDSAKLPTSERIKNVLKSPDPTLAELYFQFGRYLLIAGSRPGTQPLNLQGIWNNQVIPPWACGYTININTEMNYWPAEPGNLSECTEPLLRMIRELSVDGARVAREMYHARGWVAHHNTTLWRDAGPVDNAAQASFWPMGSGWLCQHLYDHYLFTGDANFLRRDAYPLMKGACEFYLDWLVDDGQGRLITPVSTSPENKFQYPGADGKPQRSSVSRGSAMDMAIIRDLFRNTLQAAEVLQADADFRATLKGALGKLLPYQIGRAGGLMEWYEDFQETDPKHRHVSHLFGLHPGREISLRGTPQLAAAAKRSIELRGDGGTGWSKAWKISFWARLEDGDHAYKMFEELIAKSTLPSLLDTCPPFQIDGNFGGAAGLIEMLLQSHIAEFQNSNLKFEIHLLPALPAAWPSGSIKGLRARGGYEVDLTWQDNRLTSATLIASQNGECQVRYGNKTVLLKTQAGQKYVLNGELK